jgi:hypothetical protein
MRAIKEGIVQMAPGLKDLVPEIGAELKRLGVQGTMELSSGLFHGSAFVPYGPGQYTPSPEREPAEHANGHER